MSTTPAPPLSPSPARSRPSARAIDALKRVLTSTLGDANVITDPEAMERYGEDASLLGRFPPDLVAHASSREDVEAVLAAATEHGVPVTPRGLGSGKSGGALPIHGGVVLSLERMARIKEISREDMLIVAEPGVVTQDLMNAVEQEGLFYPPDPNSLTMCSIGGNVACNAGGPRALKYGVTRNYVLGVEVVLPTGGTLALGRRTIKGVTGYDLTGLIVGSEGTLGVITEVTLRLVPKPPAVHTALVSFPDLDTASSALTRVFATGIVPRTLELIDTHALSVIRKKTPGRFPERAGALIILETDGTSEAHAFEDLERAANACLESGALDVVLAQDEAQRAKIWEPRRMLSTTLTESAPRKISEDIVVPRSQISTMLRTVARIGEKHGVRVASYGHAGDGNLHVNVLFGLGTDAEAAAHAAVLEIMETTVALRGTISGEHGIGLGKRDFLHLEQSEPLIELQQTLKRTLDPMGILNPGKIFPARGVRE